MTHEQQTSDVLTDQPVETVRHAKNRARTALLILSIFLGGGALFGGVMAFISPDFMGSPLIVPILQKIPLVGPYITSLAIPAMALLLCIFVPHLIAIILLFGKRQQQYICAIICGVLVVAFTAGELIFIPNPVSVLFLFFGVVEIALAAMCAKSQ